MRLSVVVVTHDSRAAVEASLPALARQLGPEDELVVVDNASRDGTVDRVRELLPSAVILERANDGFAGGANAGAATARGDLLLFLNPDATPAPGFVEAICAPAGHGRWTAWMGLVTARGGTVVNTTGGIVHFTGIAWAGQAGVPRAEGRLDADEVGFLSGACLAVPRSAWRALGGFAADFFMYHEDVDLSLRIRLTGGRLGLASAAVVDHDYEFHKGASKWRWLERNRWATVLRCWPTPLLVLTAPALLATELALLPVAAAGGWLPEKLRAMGSVLRWLPALLRQRRRIQATRAVSAAEFAAGLTADLDSAFLGRVARSPFLRRTLRLYWGMVLTALRAGRSRPQ